MSRVGYLVTMYLTVPPTLTELLFLLIVMIGLIHATPVSVAEDEVRARKLTVRSLGDKLILVEQLMERNPQQKRIELDEIIQQAEEMKEEDERRSIYEAIQRSYGLSTQADPQQKRTELDEIIQHAEELKEEDISDETRSVDEMIERAARDARAARATERMRRSTLKFLDSQGECEVLEESDEVMDCNESKRMVEDPAVSVDKRGRVTSVHRLWPTSEPIHYSFDPKGEFSDYNKAVIRVAMDEIERYSCLTFQEVDDANPSVPHRLRFINDIGCYAHVGMRRSSFRDYQDVSLGPNCRSKSVSLHEILHALGSWHEQSRYDRGDYVNINQENVQDGKMHNFNTYPEDKVQDFGIPYDYQSIMHYGQFYFVKGSGAARKPTISTKDSVYQDVIGTNDGLSFLDIKTLNVMYQCRPDGCQLTDDSCPGDGFVDVKCRCVCPTDRLDSRLQECGQDSDTCLLGDYAKFDFYKRVASCEDHMTSSHSALHRICTSSKYLKYCCTSCRQRNDTENPDCPYGDSADWCEDFLESPDRCQHGQNAAKCCKTCADLKAANPECPFGDQSWCAATAEKHGAKMCYWGKNADKCCQTCADLRSSNAECPWGDKAGWCRSNLCYGSNIKQCCQTCAAS